MKDNLQSCTWPSGDALMVQYHDEEWGVPLHDDKKLFEFLILDAFQAGLSWKTILYKRENFRKAFADFEVEKVSQFTEDDFNRLIVDAGIIRNKLKISATIKNSILFLEVQREFGSFSQYIWKFVGHKTIVNHWTSSAQIPSKSIESDVMSKDLQRRGFKFVGSTICYAFMQAAGMVNDHLIGCKRHKSCQAEMK